MMRKSRTICPSEPDIEIGNIPILTSYFPALAALALLGMLVSVGGCAVTSGAGRNVPPSALTINTGSLPQGQKQSEYQGSLIASGGLQPYRWSVISGSLPAGLALTDSTGMISGTPTQTGSSTFQVQVQDSSSPIVTASAPMSISVTAASSLQISNAPLHSGVIQASYSANLSASGGRAPYGWSLVSGQLPAGLSLGSSGLISGTPTTAGQSSFTVQVTDSTSPTPQTASALMSISVTAASSLQISNVPLPSGVIQASYSANLSASGGRAPYGWSLVSGQLPAGLSLGSSGLISGTPTTAGQSSFTVQVIDSTSPTPQTASAKLQITISTSTQSGASPYTSRTDHALIPLPVPLPSVGGATGAGKCITQPGYNNLVCRATDINTLGATSNPNLQNFSSCCGGWGDLNAWNKTSTMFFVSTNGGSVVVMSFNPTTHAIAPLYGQPIQGGMWSHINADVAYTFADGTGPTIGSMTFSSQTTPPQAVPIADLAAAPNCVPALAGNTQWMELSVSLDEQTFVVGAGTGVQNSAIYVIVYDRTKGCRWYNTQTGQIGGNWGPSGQATTGSGYTVHSVRISGDGQTVLITPAPPTPRQFWTIDSLQVQGAPADANTGHFSIGYSGMINNAGYTADHVWCKLGMAYRTFADVSNPTYIIPAVAQCGSTGIGGEDHSSWNNDDTSDDQPFFTSTALTPYGTPINSAWQNEVLGFSRTNPGTVWRFASTYNTGTSSFFTCQNGIGTVSQDGKWFMFTSDWGNTLGLDSTGTHRCDVFIAQLK